MLGYRGRIWLPESERAQAVGKLPAPAVADITLEEPALARKIVWKITSREVLP
jgi:hypothetical protein